MNSFDTLTAKFRKEVLNSTLLTNGKFNSKSFGSNQTEIDHITFELSAANKNFSDSKYFYKNEKLFFHYSSIDALKSILKEKSIRMYNLLNGNDPNEYEYATDLLNLQNIGSLKENVFVFSMSERNPLYDEDPLLWRLYGLNGYGCAILFEIENNPEDWFYFHLSKIYYENKSDIDQFYEKVSEFEKTYKALIKYDLSRLICFHKNLFWSYENEVRLVAYFKNQLLHQPISKQVLTDINKRNQRILYNMLNLDFNLNNVISENQRITTPKIKIKKIILGYNLINISDIRHTIYEIIKETLKYNIPIEESRFKGKIL